MLDRNVPINDLVFTKSLSKGAKEYEVSTVETGAVAQLDDEGKELRGGQTLRYIITDYYRKNKKKRSLPVEMINEATTYDASRYIELLAETCNVVMSPFGHVVIKQSLRSFYSRYD